MRRHYRDMATPAMTVFHVIRDGEGVSQKLFESWWHYSIPVSPLIFFIRIEVGIRHCTTLVSDHHSLPKLFPNKTFRSCHVLLRRRLYNSNSYCITGWCKHAIHIQTLHPPSSNLEPASIWQLSRKVTHRVVPIQSVQIWNFRLLRNLYSKQTKWRTPAIQGFTQTSDCQCSQIYCLKNFKSNQA